MGEADQQGAAKGGATPIVLPSTITVNVNVNTPVGAAVLAAVHVLGTKLDALLAAVVTDPARLAAITTDLKQHSDRAKAALDAANNPTA